MKILTIVILTRDEEKHLPRLLRSINNLDTAVCIVDSYSTDRTIEIAQQAGALIFQNPFINYAAQFQWALDNCYIRTPWVMRMDADEYLTPELVSEIMERLPNVNPDVGGIVLKRRVHFLDKWIRHGGYYPVKLLRIWRNGIGSIEQRWMDEHILLSSGSIIEFQNDIIDDNLNNLTWWAEKHNHYATREAIDVLNVQYGLFKENTTEGTSVAEHQHTRKRWYKENLYIRLPLFLRAFMYFLYRYILKLGFLDGYPGFIWHFLQGFWYRFLVDAKIYQIKWYARKEKISIREAIEEKFKTKIEF